MTRVAILGFGTEGRVAYEYFRTRLGSVEDIVIFDQDVRRTIPPGASAVRGPGYLEELTDFDLVFRSPGIDPRLLPNGLPTTSTARYFIDHCPAKVIGVTGTKSDAAVYLIAAMLREGGHRVWSGGNLPSPPLSILDSVESDDLVVFGMSSFQLQDMSRSPRIAVALAADGADLKYHRDLEEYLHAKSGIARHQKEEDVMVFCPGNVGSLTIASASVARKQPCGDTCYGHVDEARLCIGDTVLVPLSESRVAAAYGADLVNAATTAAWNLLDDPDPLRAVLAGLDPDYRRRMALEGR